MIQQLVQSKHQRMSQQVYHDSMHNYTENNNSSIHTNVIGSSWDDHICEFFGLEMRKQSLNIMEISYHYYEHIILTGEQNSSKAGFTKVI